MCETCGYDWVAPRRTKANETDQDIEEDIARLRQRTEKVTVGLERVRQSVPFTTVPLPAIGTRPTPESPFGWTVGAKVE